MLFCFFVSVVTESCKTKQCHFCILVVPDRLQKPKLNPTVLQAECDRKAGQHPSPSWQGKLAQLFLKTPTQFTHAPSIYKLVINHLTPTVPHKDNNLGSLQPSALQRDNGSKSSHTLLESWAGGKEGVLEGNSHCFSGLHWQSGVCVGQSQVLKVSDRKPAEALQNLRTAAARCTVTLLAGRSLPRAWEKSSSSTWERLKAPWSLEGVSNRGGQGMYPHRKELWG